MRIFVSLIQVVALPWAVLCERIWKTIYMDQNKECGRTFRNDDMEAGDAYLILSDSWAGQSSWVQTPPECIVGFNLGGRYVSAQLKNWRCSKSTDDLFIDVYGSCDGTRENLLQRWNCTGIYLPSEVAGAGSCISIYTYRGRTTEGYFFKVEITALQEVLSFSAAGVASLIFVLIILIMVIIKIICVATGYEDRLPDLNLDPEEQRQILESAERAIQFARLHQNGKSKQNKQPGSGERVYGHKILRVTLSNSSTSYPASPAKAEVEYELCDTIDNRNVAPRLNRFPSFKGATIWRAK